MRNDTLFKLVVVQLLLLILARSFKIDSPIKLWDANEIIRRALMFLKDTAENEP